MALMITKMTMPMIIITSTISITIPQIGIGKQLRGWTRYMMVLSMTVISYAYVQSSEEKEQVVVSDESDVAKIYWLQSWQSLLFWPRQVTH